MKSMLDVLTILSTQAHPDIMEEEYTLDQAVALLTDTIARKRTEIADLEKKKKRLKKESSIQQMQDLIDYLEADLTAYITVVADMKEDDSMLEGLDLENDKVVECPELYDKYISELNADDLENELEADAIRADYCDAIVEDLCIDIGRSALKSKKMIKTILEDPYTLEALGELIFYDDYLYDSYQTIMAQKKAKKKKKKD